jgi:hypothetical protein
MTSSCDVVGQQAPLRKIKLRAIRVRPMVGCIHPLVQPPPLAKSVTASAYFRRLGLDGECGIQWHTRRLPLPGRVGVVVALVVG